MIKYTQYTVIKLSIRRKEAMKMDLLGLRYFCQAAEYESFARVAQKNLIPISSVSQVIKRIEGELGAQLFDRRGNKVRLNDAGRRYYARIRNAIREIDLARGEVTEGEGAEGEIKLLVLTNRQRTAAAIEALVEKHPGISFSISHRHSEGFYDYDIIISDSLPEQATNYESSVFIKEKMMLAAKADSPIGAMKAIDAEDLEGISFITMLEGSRLYGKTKEIFTSLGISPTISVKCDDPAIIRRYIEIGLGVCIVPSVSWGGFFPDRIRLVDIGEFYRTTYVFRNKASISKRVNLFLEEVKSLNFVN